MLVTRRPGADTPRVYTTCMHALRMHFLPATGLYGLARGSAAAAQRFQGSMRPTWCFLRWFLRVQSRGAALRRRRREGRSAAESEEGNDGFHGVIVL